MSKHTGLVFLIEKKGKNYRQTHRMDYMLFASVIRRFFDKRTSQKIVVLEKCVTRTEFRLKILKFVVNFKKSVLWFCEF